MNFKEWILNEGMPAHWAPEPAAAKGTFASALEKISQNMGQMPFNGNFTGMQTIQVRFGMTPEEVNALHKAGLFVRNEMGINIDRLKFQQARQQLHKQGALKPMAPKPAMQQMTPPPPAPAIPNGM